MHQRGPLAEALAEAFSQHADHAIIASFPGLGAITGSRILAEFGDDRARFGDARAVARWFTGTDRPLAARAGWAGQDALGEPARAGVAAMGWKAVTATHGPGTVISPPGSQDLRLGGASGILVIVDYADRWPLTQLTLLMSNSLLYRPEVHTRVLMLARGADVWVAVRATLANEQIDTSKQHLRELPDGTGLRAEMFHAARNSFAAVYGVDDGSHLRPPVPLEHPTWV